MKTYKETINHIAENIQSKHTTGIGMRSDTNIFRMISYVYGVDEERIRMDVNEICNKLFGVGK